MPPQETLGRDESLVVPPPAERSVAELESDDSAVLAVREEEEEEEETLAPIPRNVRLVLLYTWVAFTGRGLWNQNCLATLVFLLKNGDPKAVGFLTAAMGLAQLGTSVPTGILADKYRRDTLLKAGAGVGLAAGGVSIAAAFAPSYGRLVVALVLWGIHWGIVNTSIVALFSDSIPDGERSYYFTQRAVLINVANTCGPAIALVMFAFMGDQWTIRDCCWVLLAGNLVSLPGLGLLCYLRDDEGHTDNEEEDDDETVVHGNTSQCSPPATLEVVNNSNNNNNNDLEEPLLPPTEQTIRQRRMRPPPRRSSSTADTHRDETYDEAKLGRWLRYCCCCCRSHQRLVPSLVATADIVGGFASGMSIRYIAIFLYDNLQLSPVAVQVVYIFNPILQVVLRKKSQSLAGTYGRCAVTVALKWMGISLMLSMVFLYHKGVSRVLVCAILILRTACMNSPSSLTKSVLMDHVPKAERAKWASLESVSMVSWSGSAALGGILVEKKGILFNFCVTAGLQFLATGPLVLLSLCGNNPGDENDTEHVDNDEEEYESMNRSDSGFGDEDDDEEEQT